MKQLIDRLEAWLQSHHPTYVEALRPGASDAQLSLLDPRAPETIKQMYRWHDGDDLSVGMFSGYHFLPLGEAASRSEDNAEERDGSGLPDSWWSDDWYPLFDDSSGNLICLELRYRSLQLYYLDNDSRPLVAPSLEALLGGLLESFEAGLWKVEDGRNRPTDPDAVAAILAKREVSLPL